MKERLNRRRKIALTTAAAILTGAVITGAAIKYGEVEANIRTLTSAINPDLASNALVIKPTQEQIATEKALITKYGFEPLPLGQIQDKKELARETRRRIEATISYLAQSQNPLFKETADFLKEEKAKKSVLVYRVDSLSPDYLPMHTSAAVNSNGLSYGLAVSDNDASYSLNTVGMALLLTKQVEGIKHNMEYVIPFGDDIVALANQQSAYLTNEVSMAEREVRENAILTQALLYQSALGYEGPVHLNIQTDARRFIEVYGNPLLQ